MELSTILNSLTTAVISTISIIVGIFMVSDCDLYLKYCYFDKNSGFKGKKVWIAGASSGIGRQLVIDMTKAGATVIVSARRVDLLNDVANEACKYGKSQLSLTVIC